MTEEETRAAKRRLRNRMRGICRMMAPQKRDICSQRILAKLYREYYYRQAHCVMLYASMPEEVQLQELFAAAWDSGKTVCLPYIISPGIMEAIKVKSFDDLVPGSYGILTVKDSCREAVPGREIDCVIVPGAAFGRAGERIGRGGGYYDRFLTGEASHAYRVGLAFACQISEDIPMEYFDARMDTVITEQETIVCQR